MSGFFKRYSGRREYRLASAILAAACLVTDLAPGMLEFSSGAALLAVAISISSYVVLAILTYHRIRDASLSGWWLLPMFIVFHVGPQWQLGSWWWGSSSFTPSGIISFLPVIIGWFATAKNAEQASHDSTQVG
jgi:uncharacterized membrane protein YhaH (DUF805 family)